MKKTRKYGRYILLLLLCTAGLIYCFTRLSENTQAEEVLIMAKNIRAKYSFSPDYRGLGTAKALADGIVPEKMSVSGKIVGKDVLIGSGIEGSIILPSVKYFDIIYKGMSKKKCVEFTSFKFDKKQAMTILGIEIIHDNQSAYFSWGEANPLPINEKVAAKACGENNNTIIWKFE